MEIMKTLAVIAVLALFVFGITKAKDASMRAKGQSTPAPEWARLLFVLAVVGLLFACLGPGLIAGLH